jgi:hypothetical protein
LTIEQHYAAQEDMMEIYNQRVEEGADGY